MRLMKQKGISKVDSITTDEGFTIDIKLNKTDGEFQANFDGVRFNDKELRSLKDKIIDYSKKEKGLKYEPVIELVPEDHWNSDTGIGFVYRRYFRAKKADGTFLFREFIPTRNEGEEYGDACEGTFGSKTYVDSKAKFISYSPDKWKALRHIHKQMNLLREKLRGIMAGEKAENFLENINNQNIKFIEFKE